MTHNTITARHMGLTPKEFLTVAAQTYNVTPSQIAGGKRQRPLPQIRHVLAWYIYHSCRLSLHETGKIMGINHSTVIFGMKAVDNRANDFIINEVYLSLTEAFMKFRSTLPTDRFKIAEGDIDQAWRQPLLDECERLRSENADLKRRMQFLAEQYQIPATDLDGVPL